MRKVCAFVIPLLFVSCASLEQSPDENQIKADLIGQQIGNMFFGWRIDSLSEFEKFEIKEKTQTGNIIEYKIFVQLQGTSGVKVTADLLVIYKKDDSKWRFVNVTDNNTLQVIR